MMDSRFAHVANDPRFKRVYAREVQLDTDDTRFKNQSSSLYGPDPRGRKYNVGKEKILKTNRQAFAHNQFAQGQRKREDHSDDAKSFVSSDSDEDQNNEAIDSFVDLSEDEEEVEKMNNDMDNLCKKLQSEIQEKKVCNKRTHVFKKFKAVDSAGEEDSERRKHRLAQLLDPSKDIARGLHEFSGESSSSDDESSSDEEVEEDEWGDLDKDAIRETDENSVEETTRLALCNLEWDLFKAEDILMVCRSFAPPGGKVLRAAVYLSEYGKQKRVEDEKCGPKEVTELPLQREDDDTVDKAAQYATARRYYINRLKYYYAVVECDTVNTARILFKELDGQCFKNGGILDMRYIPNEMTFDETPESESTAVRKNYANDKLLHGFSAYNLVNTKLTWDEDDEERKKTLRYLTVDADEAQDDPNIKKFLASDSEDSESDEAEEESQFTSWFESAERETKLNRIKLYRNLFATMNTYDHAMEMEEKLLARSREEQDSSKEEVHMEAELSDEEPEEEEKKNGTLSEFEKYLMKRLKRQKENKKAKKLEGKQTDDLDMNVPDFLKNDPFFREELEKRSKEKLAREKLRLEEENKEFARKEKERIEREKEMSLLLLDDKQSSGEHFDMRVLVKQAKIQAASQGGNKKLSHWKLAKLAKKAKRLKIQGLQLPDNKATDTVLSEAPFTANSVIQDERFTALFSDPKANIDPSHPEFAKHNTPFLNSLIQEIQRTSKHSIKRKASAQTEFLINKKACQ